jgi:hypothetical protein
MFPLAERVCNRGRSRPDWGLAISEYCLALFLLVCGAVESPVATNGKASCQRIELSDLRVTPPELVLDFGANQKPMRFTVARLGRMTRSTVALADHRTTRILTFEGVDITWLVLAKHQPRRGQAQTTAKTLRGEGAFSGRSLELGGLEVSFGFFRKKMISGKELDANSKVIILDTVGGKIWRRYTPFCLVIEMGHGRKLLFRHLTRVAIRPSV